MHINHLLSESDAFTQSLWSSWKIRYSLVNAGIYEWILSYMKKLRLLFIFCNLGKLFKNFKWHKFKTRLSYYNVTTRLVDLVGLCWF